MFEYLKKTRRKEFEEGLVVCLLGRIIDTREFTC